MNNLIKIFPIIFLAFYYHINATAVDIYIAGIVEGGGGSGFNFLCVGKNMRIRWTFDPTFDSSQRALYFFNDDKPNLGNNVIVPFIEGANKLYGYITADCNNYRGQYIRCFLGTAFLDLGKTDLRIDELKRIGLIYYPGRGKNKFNLFAVLNEDEKNVLSFNFTRNKIARNNINNNLEIKSMGKIPRDDDDSLYPIVFKSWIKEFVIIPKIDKNFGKKLESTSSYEESFQKAFFILLYRNLLKEYITQAEESIWDCKIISFEDYKKFLSEKYGEDFIKSESLLFDFLPEGIQNYVNTILTSERLEEANGLIRKMFRGWMTELPLTLKMSAYEQLLKHYLNYKEKSRNFEFNYDDFKKFLNENYGENAWKDEQVIYESLNGTFYIDKVLPGRNIKDNNSNNK